MPLYMENFNPLNYRDNLAKDLKEIRKEDDHRSKMTELLDDKKDTLEYDIEKENKELNKRTKKNPESKIDILNQEIFERPKVKVVEKDISSFLPDSIKEYNSIQKIINAKYLAILLEFGEDKNSAYKAKKDAVKKEEEALSDKFNKKYPEFKKKNNQELVESIDKITGGDFMSHENLNHVIGAYTQEMQERKSYDDRFVYLHGGIKRSLRNIVHGFNPDSLIGKGETEYGDHLYFASGGNVFLKPDSTLVIFDPNESRFQKSLEIGAVNHDKSEAEMTIKAALANLKEVSKETGVTLDLKPSMKWKELAKWIIDLPAQKVYLIEEDKQVLL